MTDCKICDVEEEIQFKCNHCGSVFCSDHRLPEAHDCPALIVFDEVDSAWFSDKRDIANLQSGDIDVPDDVIEEIEDAPVMNTRSQAVRDRKTREMIDMLSSSVEVDEETDAVVVDSESAYETVEPGTVGTSIDPDYDGSPGMNPDGSLKRDEVIQNEEESVDDESSELSPFARLLFMLLVLCVVATSAYFLLI